MRAYRLGAALAGLILAAVFIIWGAELATRHLRWESTDSPYWVFGLPLVLLGLLCAAVGILALRRAVRTGG